MASLINTNLMKMGNREFLLVDVRNSLSQIGFCPVTGRAEAEFERRALSELFFVGDEPIINITKSNKNDQFSNKIISLVSSIHLCNEAILALLNSVCENYFVNSQSLSKSVQPILDLLCDGLYVIHEGRMLQSDGEGNFFWNAYSMRREVNGTSDYNAIIGVENNYTPCFLIPTCTVAEFSEGSLRAPSERIKNGDKIGGLAFAISGMFSALISGHGTATATLLNNAEFDCIVIEPIRDILYENSEHAAQYGREPLPLYLSCPFVKIPLDTLPSEMLENFLLQRKGKKPYNYNALIQRALRPVRHNARRVIPQDLNSKAEALPDCKMIESATVVESLSDEQLEALLAGETSYDGKMIISNNYYNSVVVACNFLQYKDFEKFIDFALSIISTPDLAATHKYVTERLSNIMNSKIYRFFKTIKDSTDPVYTAIQPLIDNYILRYDNIADRVQQDSSRSLKMKETMKRMETESTAVGLAKMESFIKKSKEGGKAQI